MPEITIEIGGRQFEVSCQDGEEQYLQAAAQMLNEEAAELATQIGRTPELRMLLMAGLMLADKTAGVQDKLREAEGKLAEMGAELTQLRGAGADAVKTQMPEGLTKSLTEIAVQAEALADMAEGAKAG